MDSSKLVVIILIIDIIIDLLAYIVLRLLIEDIREKQVTDVIKRIVGEDLKREYKGIKLKDIKLKFGMLEIYVIIDNKDVVWLREKIANEIENKVKSYFHSCQKHVFNVKLIFEES